MSQEKKTKMVNLALQGGGAHCAFAWGVLDKILEDGRLQIDGLTGTSAGAMNTVVYSYGKMMGGYEGAREALHNFWKDISETGAIFSPVKITPLEAFFMENGGGNPWSFQAFEAFTQMFSPYDFNPMDINPLRHILERHVDFEQITECKCTKMFICATNVRTNRIKVFKNKEITTDSVLASACLPMLFQAVEIDGEAYWDGGYMGNPALYPLFYHTDTDDMMIIHINPIEREEVPKKAHEIHNRINEISFNSSLLREIRAIAFIQKLVEEGWIKEGHKSKITHEKFYMHSIRADNIMRSYSVASKFSPGWKMLCEIRDKGREVMEEWLEENYKHVGNKCTVDLRSTFLDHD